MNDEKVHNQSEFKSSVPVILVYQPSDKWERWEKFRLEGLEELRSRSQTHQMTEDEMQLRAAGHAHRMIEQAEASSPPRASDFRRAETSAASAPKPWSHSRSKFRFAPQPTQRHVGRHSRKCTVCRHPYRAAIEQDFLNWRSAENLASDYGIPHHSAIYRHAHATGLFPRRGEFMRSVLDHVLARSGSCVVAGDTMVRAIRAHTRITNEGKWVEPTRLMIYSVEPSATKAVKK